MMPLDEKDLQLLAEVLPNVSAQLRSSMANVFAAANRLAPAEAREADPMLDKNAAILTMSCHQMLRLVGNLSAVSELVQGGRFRLCNDDIVGFCHALCERAALIPRRRTVSASGCPSAAASRRGTAGCSWRNPLSVRARPSRSRCPTPARRICRCPTAALTMPAASTMFSWS